MPTVEAIRRWVAHNRHAFTEQTQAHYSSVIWRFAHAAPKFIKDLTVEHIESYIRPASRAFVDGTRKLTKSQILRQKFALCVCHHLALVH